MDDYERLDPSHLAKRNALRRIGPIVFGVGVLFMIVGLVDFFSSMNSFEGPKLFWCFFVGMPLLFLGSVMSMMGFMGALARFNAAEGAPVMKDTINYMADGTKGAVRTTAHAAAQGIAEGLADAGRAQFCTQCGHQNDSDAKFCKSCGKPMTAE